MICWLHYCVAKAFGLRFPLAFFCFFSPSMFDLRVLLKEVWKSASPSAVTFSYVKVG